MSMGSAMATTLRAILADRAALVTMIVAVVIYGFYYPEAYRHQAVDRLPVAVVDLDGSALSRSLLRDLDTLRGVRIASEPGSLADAEGHVHAGRADAILLVLPGFGTAVLRGERGQLAVFGNGSNLLRASSALTALGEGIAGFAVEAGREQARFLGAPAGPALHLVQRPLYNTRVGYGSTVVPAVGQLIAQQTLLIGMVLVLAGWRERRGARLVMPAATFAGVAACFVLVGLFSSAYFAGFVPWFQDYPRGGNPAALALAIPAFVLAVVAFGLFIGSFFRVRERALLFLLPVALPMYFLSGVSWPVQAIPAPLTWLGALVPSTHGIPLLLKLNQVGAHWHETAAELASLAALTLLHGALAWWRYRPGRAGHDPD